MCCLPRSHNESTRDIKIIIVLRGKYELKILIPAGSSKQSVKVNFTFHSFSLANTTRHTSFCVCFCTNLCTICRYPYMVKTTFFWQNYGGPSANIFTKYSIANHPCINNKARPRLRKRSKRNYQVTIV